MKFCSCGTGLSNRNRTGLCTPCYQKEYRKNNIDKLKEYDKKRFKENPERGRKNRERYHKNKNEISARRRKLYEENQEEARSKQRDYYSRNKEKYKKYRQKDAEGKKQYMQEYRILNKERIEEQTRIWRLNNLDKQRLKTRQRKARVKQATPSWAKNDEWEQFFMQEIYHLARLREKLFEKPLHVDHTVPLKSDIVCGLHVSQNLQILVKEENLSKGNRWWPDMP